MHISISEFVISLCFKYQVVLSCASSKNMQFLAISPYFNPITYTSCEPLRNIKFSTASHLTIVKKTEVVTSLIIHITNRNGLAFQLVLTRVMANAITMFSAWAVVKIRQMPCTIKQKN